MISDVIKHSKKERKSMVFQDKLTRSYLVFTQLKKVRQDKYTKRITTIQLAIKQYTPMKHLEINYQKHKIDNRLLCRCAAVPAHEAYIDSHPGAWQTT